MYIPNSFTENDTTVLHQIMQDNPLATIITQGADGICANHIPLLFVPNESEHGILVGHVARANPIWQQTDTKTEHLAIFQCTNAYITPNWYPTKKEHGKAVPTWNYEAVHVCGHIRFIEDADWLYWQINTLTNKHEKALSQLTGDEPWQVADAPDGFIDKLVSAIVGLEITITSVKGKRKLSQNQPLKNQQGVKQGLENLNSIKRIDTK